MPPDELQLRHKMIDTGRRLEALGLNQGTSGNLSVRAGPDPSSGFLLTPTNLAYTQMVPDDIVHVSMDGICSGRRRPSSELDFHLKVMQARTDAGAVIHTHSIYATTLSCLRKEVSAIHYLVGIFGGNNIPCAEYATFGTPELSANLLRALENRRAVLLSNHGLVVLGSDLEQALSLTAEAETLATITCRALSVGAPVILSDDEMAKVVEKFRAFGYGPVGAREG